MSCLFDSLLLNVLLLQIFPSKPDSAVGWGALEGSDDGYRVILSYYPIRMEMKI